ncbi:MULTISPECIES: hypothetical protein [unclassified Variovorax]|uniref:hypothetical protein n=1 Tax=unclassified Variovorax TaxID=663243 RepID=UPI00177E57C7|nr:hypothetical protein [Variovorax sp. VRV01]MBD9663214.1 hypothetical protein [Variovorax sp. VRV01]
MAAALALLVFEVAHAEWANEELEARNLPKAQWNAIAKGDFSQCQSDAAAASRQAFPGSLGCQETMAPYLYQQCISALKSRRNDGEQMKQPSQLDQPCRLGWTDGIAMTRMRNIPRRGYKRGYEISFELTDASIHAA